MTLKPLQGYVSSTFLFMHFSPIVVSVLSAYPSLRQHKILKVSTMSWIFLPFSNVSSPSSLHPEKNSYGVEIKPMSTNEKLHTFDQCPKCTLSLSALGNIHRHLREPTEEKPYNCSHCSETSSSSSDGPCTRTYCTGEKPCCNKNCN